LPLILNHQFGYNLKVFEYQHFLVAFGPFLSAILTETIFEGVPAGVTRYIKRIFNFAINKQIYLFVLIAPILLFIIGVIIDYIINGKLINFSQIGLTNQINSTNLIFIILVWLFSYGLGEEGGWRGFLLPLLNKYNSAFKTSIIISFIWIFWHLPFFFYDQNFINMGIMLIGWTIGIIFGSILLSFITINASYSIVPVIIWHGIFDFLTSSNISSSSIAAVMSLGVICIAIFIHKKYGNNLQIST